MLQLVAQSSSDAASAGALGFVGVVYLVILVATIAGMWKIFEKAGEDGWKAIIPIYNLYVLLKIVGRPGWWLVLVLIPLVNIVVLFIVFLDLARSFGRDIGVAVGLFFLGFVFLPILGFGDATYDGPAAA